jgi:hypothetical protein
VIFFPGGTFFTGLAGALADAEAEDGICATATGSPVCARLIHYSAREKATGRQARTAAGRELGGGRQRRQDSPWMHDTYAPTQGSRGHGVEHGRQRAASTAGAGPRARRGRGRGP